MQNPVFYGAFLAISWIKPRSVVTNYSECMRSNSAYRDAYVTRSQTQSLVCLWLEPVFGKQNDFKDNRIQHFFFLSQAIFVNLFVVCPPHQLNNLTFGYVRCERFLRLLLLYRIHSMKITKAAKNRTQENCNLKHSCHTSKNLLNLHFNFKICER